MARIVRPNFKIFREANGNIVGRRAAVFVHGIYSSHETFEPVANGSNTDESIIQAFTCDPRFLNWDLCWFDYDFNQPMTDSAKQLSDSLWPHFVVPGQRVPVTLIGHSMGGLVSRLAVLRKTFPTVEKVIMLGTPNFGAVRTAKMAILALITLKTARRLYAVFGRQRGVLDLTRSGEVVRQYLDSNPGLIENADAVDYVTIPGLFFHQNRAILETDDSAQAKTRNSSMFGHLQVGIELLGYTALLRVGIEKPHDGIVEEVSNCLIPPEGQEVSFFSEKLDPILNPSHFPLPTYAHLVHEDCSELTHVMIHKNRGVVKLVCDIAAAATLDSWYKGLPKSGRSQLIKRRIPGG